MKIRRACKSDAFAICEISNALIRNSLVTFTTVERSVESTKASLGSSDTEFWVAEQAGEVVGFASYAAFRSGPGYAHTKELSIHLRADARGQGTGRVLLARLEDHARQAGVHVLVAGISSANRPGMAFHKALGFSKVGHMPEVGYKAGQWLDLILMQKTL